MCGEKRIRPRRSAATILFSFRRAMGYEVHSLGRVVGQGQFLWLTFQKTCEDFFDAPPHFLVGSGFGQDSFFGVALQETRDRLHYVGTCRRDAAVVEPY